MQSVPTCPAIQRHDHAHNANRQSRRRQSLLLHRLLKNLQRHLWLIERDLVPSAKHSQKTEIIDILEGA